MPTPSKRKIELNDLIGYKAPKGNPRPITKAEQDEIDQINRQEAAQRQFEMQSLNRTVDQKLEQERLANERFNTAFALGYDALKVFDPTGVSSYPDVAEAWSDGKFTSNDITEPLGALPFGLFKGVKTIEGMKGAYSTINTMGKLQEMQRAINYGQGIKDGTEDLGLSFKKGGMKKYNSGGMKTLQGIDFSNPWQVVNPNSPEMMQQVYNPVATANANAIKIADDPMTPMGPATTTSSMSSFGTPNWNYIFGSQMVQGLVNGIASRNPNSRSSGARQFNQQKFNPLNYLPTNPNLSQQDLYGGDFAEGGTFGSAFAKARKELGAGQIFEWNGNKYSTNVAGEENGQSLSWEAGAGTNRPTPRPQSFSWKAGEGNKPQPLSWSAGSGTGNQGRPSNMPSQAALMAGAKAVMQGMLENRRAERAEEEAPGIGDKLAGYWDGFTQRVLPAMQSEDKESTLVVKPQTIQSVQDNPIYIKPGYNELGTVRDVRGTEKDSLVSFTNMFDNMAGGRYYLGHDIAEAGNNANIPNSEAVAHFIMDGDILPGQKNPGSYTDAKGQKVDSKVPGKFLNSAIDWNNPNGYGMGTKLNDDGSYNIVYRKVGDITPEEKKNFNFEASVRNMPYSNINWDGEGPDTHFYSKSHYVPTNDGSATSIPYKDKNSFSRFSGGSGIYSFKDPKTGKDVGIDVSGSVNVLKDVGDKILKQYGIKADDLQFLYHDMGSYSAKPKAQNGNLNYSQWSNYNTYNKGRSGAPIIIPKKAEGGQYGEDEDADFLFGEDSSAPITPSTVEKSKRQMRMEGEAAEQEQGNEYDMSVMNFLSSLGNMGSGTQRFQNVATFTQDADEVAKTVKNRLTSAGLPAHIASGFVGNFAAESSFRAGVTNGIGAFGLGQWLGDRKQNLFNFAQQQGKNPSDPTLQADFVMHELQNGEHGAFEKIMASQNSAQAAYNIGKYYERPSKAELNNSIGVRQAYAQKYQEGGEYEKWKSQLPPNLQYEGDYDLRGLYESNPTVQPSSNLHFPDTFKLPNHPTFSNESKYYDGVTPGVGGYWGEGEENFIKNPKVGPPIPPAYKKGGEYDLSESEIERLRQLGYKIEAV